MNGIQFIVNQMQSIPPPTPHKPTRKYTALKDESKVGAARARRKRAPMKISIDALAAMRDAGASQAKMERAAGLCGTTLRSRLREAGYMPLPQHIHDETLQRALVLRNAGMTWPEIAKETCRSPSGIRNALDRRGLL